MVVLRLRRCGFALLFSFALAACSGSTDSTNADPSDPDPTPADLTLSGSVGDGPAVDAAIRVTDSNDQVLVQDVSDSTANYRLTLPADTALPVLVSASGGTDLVTGRPLDFTLKAAAMETGSSTVNVSPLSTLAVRAAQCSSEGLTAQGLETVWPLVHAELGMGLDAAGVPDPMTMDVTRGNVEGVVLANEALGEAVRRTRSALAATGTVITADDIVAQLACDLVGRTSGPDGVVVQPRVVATFGAAELTVRLETMAGRLEVEGSVATERMNDAIRQTMPEFFAPDVNRVPVDAPARARTLSLVSLYRQLAGNDALVAVAGALQGAGVSALPGELDALLSTSLHNDLMLMTRNVAMADDAELAALEGRRDGQDTAPAPVLSLAADATDVMVGDDVMLSWASSDAEQCVSSWGGLVATQGAATVGPLATDTLFELTCLGLGGTVEDTVAVTVSNAPDPDPVPVVTLSASSSQVQAGGAAQLTWSATDASTCTASGGWSGGKAVSGSQSTGALNATTTFQLTCDGDGGTDSARVTVQVVQAPTPAPVVTLSASPNQVQAGGAAQLTWSTTDASACTAGGGWSGGKAVSGSQSTGALNATTTFQLTCSGDGGTDSASVTVQVQPAAPQPTVSLSAAQQVVNDGGATDLTWSSTDADACAASGGWSGGKPVSGTQSTGPLTQQTTFTLSCSGAGGSAVAMISVSVNGSVDLTWQAPTQNVDGSPLTDLAGFKIYYGPSSGNYTSSLSMPVGSSTHTLSLPSGTYYFAMTALNTGGDESAYSNEVVRTVN